MQQTLGSCPTDQAQLRYFCNGLDMNEHRSCLELTTLQKIWSVYVRVLVNEMRIVTKSKGSVKLDVFQVKSIRAQKDI